MSDIVRVLRMVEYYGPRKWVEDTLYRSIQGSRIFGAQGMHGIIRVHTLGGQFPEILTVEDFNNLERETKILEGFEK